MLLLYSVLLFIPFGVRAAAASANLSPKNEEELLANMLERYEK